MKSYLPRIADKVLEHKLESKGAVLITGPKWCGKSTTALQQAKSSVFMQDPTMQKQNIMLAKADSHLFLSGDIPKLIDEWQIIPFIWDAIRFEVDQRDEFGQFILTGSSVPADDSMIQHSGIGRITRMVMRTMSLYESLDSKGTVSLADLFANKGDIQGISTLGLQDLAFLVCRGGWPKSVGLREDIALQQAIDYYDGLLYSDISRVDNVRRDAERMRLLLRSYARNIASQATIKTIKKDMLANDSSSLDEDTISSYIKALKKLYVVEDLPAWNPNLRSKAAIRTSDTRHFIDPSIACASLGIGPVDLLNDLKTFGLLFESLCIRDLRVYAEKLDGHVYHYRDSSGLEADAVIHLRNGDWAAVEVKLFDDDLIDQGAKNLIALRNKINTDVMKEPSFLMVLTGTPYAYKRPDGVYVVPITCLKD